MRPAVPWKSFARGAAKWMPSASRRSWPGRVPAAECIAIQGAPEVAIRLPGVGTIRATGPTGSVESLRRQLDDAGLRLDRLCRGFGTQEIAALEQAAMIARDLDQKIASAQTR